MVWPRAVLAAVLVAARVVDIQVADRAAEHRSVSAEEEPPLLLPLLLGASAFQLPPQSRLPVPGRPLPRAWPGLVLDGGLRRDDFVATPFGEEDVVVRPPFDDGPSAFASRRPAWWSPPDSPERFGDRLKRMLEAPRAGAARMYAADESKPVEEVALPERADWQDMLRLTAPSGKGPGSTVSVWQCVARPEECRVFEIEVGQDGEVELPWEDRFDPDYIDFMRADLGAGNAGAEMLDGATLENFLRVTAPEGVGPGTKVSVWYCRAPREQCSKYEVTVPADLGANGEFLVKKPWTEPVDDVLLDFARAAPEAAPKAAPKAASEAASEAVPEPCGEDICEVIGPEVCEEECETEDLEAIGEALRLGATYDGEKKKWFVVRGIDMAPFKRWVKKEKAAALKEAAAGGRRAMVKVFLLSLIDDVIFGGAGLLGAGKAAKQLGGAGTTGEAGVAAAGKKIPLRSRRSLERKQTRKLKREKGKRYPVGDPEMLE